MKLILLPTAHPLLGHLAALFLLLRIGSSESGINHHIISLPSTLCTYKLNSITMISTLSAGHMHTTIPLVASSTPIASRSKPDLMHNYIKRPRKTYSCRSLPLPLTVAKPPAPCGFYVSQAILNPIKLTSYYLHPLRCVAPVVRPAALFLSVASPFLVALSSRQHLISSALTVY
ncbi:hypothetical protein GGI35DRAFT_301916 [Trichoderma velutinum]